MFDDIIITYIIYLLCTDIFRRHCCSSYSKPNDQTVRVSWSLIPSDRQPNVTSDITHYEVQYYSVGGSVQELLSYNVYFEIRNFI